jgi:tRNA (guanine-N7-)-methyltransferase
MIEIPRQRPIRSFVRRQGRMTIAQKEALDSLWSVYGMSIAPESSNPTMNEQRPLILDIGFGQGQSLVELAQYYTDHQVLGVEVHRPGIGQAMHLAQSLDLSNIKIVTGDIAELLPMLIPDASLSRVYILFPDPWQKSRHRKRRLIQSNFVALLVQKMRDGGIIHLATDWKDYARHMSDVMATIPNIQQQSSELHWRPHTKYEDRGLRLGYSIYDLVYAKYALSE